MPPPIPPVPDELPRTGNALTAALGRGTLGLLGWRIEGMFPPIRKIVVVIAPHTSAWDFVVGLAAKLALRLGVSYLAKDSLFRWPLGVIMRRTGGIPVDRSHPHQLVGQMTERFEASDSLLLALAPEGTRSHVDQWKTGFYRIAHGVGVPIVPVALDFGSKAVVIGDPLQPSGDLERDVAELRSFYTPIQARHPRMA